MTIIDPAECVGRYSNDVTITPGDGYSLVDQERIGRAYMPKAKRDDWGTPMWLFEWAQRRWAPEGFTLDAAATAENALCEHFFTEEDDARAHQLWTKRVWCNPPYGRGLDKWLKKALYESCYEHCELVVMLLPAKSTDTYWWHEYVIPSASQVVWIRGRVHFEGAEHPAPFPSCFVVFAASNQYRTSYRGVDVKDMRNGR